MPGVCFLRVLFWPLLPWNISQDDQQDGRRQAAYRNLIAFGVVAELKAFVQGFAFARPSELLQKHVEGGG